MALTQILAESAHRTLLANLATYQNVLGDDHRAALLEVCQLYSRILHGDPTASGRWAVSLDTGMGKTESVVAIIKAIADSGLNKSVMVCQSTVEGLFKLKGKLVAAGVPPESIGVVHNLLVDSAGAGKPGFASAPSLPADADYCAYQFLLVTHVRTKGRALDRCTEYRDGCPEVCVGDSAVCHMWSICGGNGGRTCIRPESCGDVCPHVRALATMGRDDATEGKRDRYSKTE